MKMIRNIIFDLGGVLINLDPDRTEKAFYRLGMKNFHAQYSQARQSGLFDAFDKGRISPQQFRDELKKMLPPGTTDAEIDQAWNAMLLDLPAERLALLKSLGAKYRLFLLSNTNEIHIAAFTVHLFGEHGIKDFSNYFEKWYYSCRVGMRKPDEEIFRLVLEANKLEPGETEFIDDSVQHVEGAAACGLKAVLLDVKGGDDILSYWKRRKEKQ